MDAVEKVIALQANNSQKISELLGVMEKGDNSISPQILIKTLKQLASGIDTEQTDTFQIMDYLQFQDITAQQDWTSLPTFRGSRKKTHHGGTNL